MHATSPTTRLPRPRLEGRVQALLTDPARALWIGAAVGMGKSTLAQQLLLRHGGLHLTLNDTCGDGASVLRALAALAPQRPAPVLWREQGAAPQTGLRPAWRTWWRDWPPGQWLVLDDLHHAGTDESIGQWLLPAMHEAPPTARMLLLSRRAPPAALARLQVQGLMTRLSPAELAFTPQEWHDAGRWSGWPAAMACADDPATRDHLLAQLVQTEVLAPLDAPDRELLHRLAWLDGPISADAAVALSQRDDAAQRLAALAAQGALVDELPTGWVLHELLAAPLRAVDGAEPLVKATLDWLDRQQNAAADDAAVALALRAGRMGLDPGWTMASQRLVAVGSSWLADCRHRALAAACDEVPASLRSAALWSTLAAALAAFDPRAGPARRRAGAGPPANR